MAFSCSKERGRGESFGPSPLNPPLLKIQHHCFTSSNFRTFAPQLCVHEFDMSNRCSIVRFVVNINVNMFSFCYGRITNSFHSSSKRRCARQPTGGWWGFQYPKEPGRLVQRSFNSFKWAPITMRRSMCEIDKPVGFYCSFALKKWGKMNCYHVLEAKGAHDFIEPALKSTVRKKMAAVHFTTIPCEPNTANST